MLSVIRLECSMVVFVKMKINKQRYKKKIGGILERAAVFVTDYP